MELIKKIVNKGNEEVELILNDALKEAKELKEELINEALLESETRIKNVLNEINREIDTKEKLLVYEERQAELHAKNNVINEIFNRVRIKIESLEGDDLLKYVINKIKAEKLNGDEIMHTNKDSYETYLKALSTKEKSALVDLDKLNKILNTNFKLSNKNVDISNGFILEGKYFDLNFSIEEVLEKLRNKYERQLVKELFE